MSEARIAEINAELKVCRDFIEFADKEIYNGDRPDPFGHCRCYDYLQKERLQNA